MALPTSNIDTAVYSPTDVTAYRSTPLGTSAVKHVDVHARLEAELEALSKKIGYSANYVTEASVGAMLSKQSDGKTKWKLRAASVKDYGATGDGTTDDTVAVQAAIDANDVVIFPSGTYKIGLVSYTGASRHIIGQGNVVILQSSTSGVFALRGGFDEIDTISNIASAQVNMAESGESTANNFVTQLTTTSSHVLTRGDIIKVISTDLPTGIDSNGTSEDYRTGEYSSVGIDSTGTTITLSNVLRQTFTTSPRVGRLKDVRFTISNITFDTFSTLGASMDGVYSACLSIRATNGSLLENLIFRDQYGRGIHNYAYGTKVVNCHFKNLQNRPSVQHYGYGIEDGGFATEIINCTGENMRHLYSANAQGVTVASTDLEYFGNTDSCVISNSLGLGIQGTAFDTHQISNNILFSNCIAYGSYQGADSGGGGFSGRGTNISFNNCTAFRCKLGFNVNVRDGGFLDSCKALQTANDGIDVEGYTAGGVTTQTNIVIRNCYFEAGLNTNGIISRAGLIGKTGFTVAGIIENTTFVVKGSVSGSRILEFISANFYIRNLTLDLSGFTGAVSFTGINVRDTACVLRGSDVRMIGGATPASLTVINGFSGSNTSVVDIFDMEYTHDTTNPSVFVGTNLSNPRISYFQKIGSTFTTSIYTLQTAAASLTLAIAKVPDKVITIRLTGSNGNVTIANIPSGMYPGQVLIINNISNGIVTIGTPDTAIPVQGAYVCFWDGSSWRQVVAHHRLITPFFALTASNGVNNNLASGNSATRSFCRISGPTGAFTLAGLVAGVDGQRLVLFNTTAHEMTLANEASSSTAANRITTMTGADVVLRTGTSMAELIYDSTTARWLLMNTN